MKEKELVPKELQPKPQPPKDVTQDVKKLSDRVKQLEGEKGMGI